METFQFRVQPLGRLWFVPICLLHIEPPCSLFGWWRTFCHTQVSAWESCFSLSTCHQGFPEGVVFFLPSSLQELEHSQRFRYWNVLLQISRWFTNCVQTCSNTHAQAYKPSQTLWLGITQHKCDTDKKRAVWAERVLERELTEMVSTKEKQRASYQSVYLLVWFARIHDKHEETVKVRVRLSIDHLQP